MSAKRILLDCDPGVDDALAMILALKSQNINLYGVTTVYGNVSLEKTTNNACRILEYFNVDIPVAQGNDSPLQEKMNNADSVHGKDGLGGTTIVPKSSQKGLQAQSATDFIRKSVTQGVQTIVATGPLTNIATVFQTAPETMQKIEELVIMGGAINVPGNIDRLTEFNFYADPHAADYVLQEISVPTVLVPLNVTRKVIFSPQARKQLPSNHTGKFVRSIVKHYQQFYTESVGFQGNPLHDPLAIGYVHNPQYLELTPLNVYIETKGQYTRGMCVPEQRHGKKPEPNVQVALDVKAKKFLADFKRLLGISEPSQTEGFTSVDKEP